MLGLSSYLLLLEHPPKLFVARVLIEPRPPARQNIVFSWLHFISGMIILRGIYSGSDGIDLFAERIEL
jgi:hypothetical protein